MNKLKIVKRSPDQVRRACAGRMLPLAHRVCEATLPSFVASHLIPLGFRKIKGLVVCCPRSDSQSWHPPFYVAPPYPFPLDTVGPPARPDAAGPDARVSRCNIACIARLVC